jgi:hypothetical protein
MAVHQHGGNGAPPARHAPEARGVDAIRFQGSGQQGRVQVIAHPAPEIRPATQARHRNRRIGRHAAGIQHIGSGRDFCGRLGYILHPKHMIGDDIAKADNTRRGGGSGHEGGKPVTAGPSWPSAF